MGSDHHSRVAGVTDGSRTGSEGRGKILIRRSEFDIWIAAYRQVGDPDVDQIVDDVLAKLD
jgi:hypothetical protein